MMAMPDKVEVIRARPSLLPLACRREAYRGRKRLNTSASALRNLMRWWQMAECRSRPASTMTIYGIR